MIDVGGLIGTIWGYTSSLAQEKLQRSELVIKLLKQLKLDPDHPPADFTAVYQYSLVEYGLGKPKLALEIFRQSEIQKIFRNALDQNNPSLLLKDGEAFLAGHGMGEQLKQLGIDARRELYQFAAIFIKVANRTRTPAEVLTNQRLESLHRQLGTMQERLNRLPTLEGMRTELARLAAQDYPALPGAIPFSGEQCQAFALAQQMRGWFETLGFRFEAHEVWQTDAFEWIINIPVRRGRYDRIFVRGMDGEAGLKDVEALRRSLDTHHTDEGWLVTARRISRAAREEVNKPDNARLGCYTFDELLDQDADFSGYLTWLEAEIQRRGIAQHYVPLACTKEEIDPDTKQRLGLSRYDDRDGWIDGYIDLWLDDPAKEHISVLGEFGTGKTWFALHYAWKALQRYQEAQKRGLTRPRLPLVVPLRDYAKAVSVESLFSEFFFRKHEIPIPGYSAFEQLNRMGKLLLVFDGFDEMAARVDRQQMINNFWELAKVVVPGAKVILTCRTEHFPEAREGRALLNAELQASTRDLTGETPQFEVLELEKFNDDQIRQVLSYQAQPATVEQVMGNPQLLDLARRPVLTELILEALPDIEAGKPVDMSRIYLYAVRHKMERDIKADRTFTSLADKLYFLCELSWEMLSTDRMSINYREFPDRIRQLFGSAVEEEKDLDHWHYDMMGQTMLVRNAEGDYTPAHRSLLEFFVAYKFAAELGALAPDFLELMQSQSCLDSAKEASAYTWSGYFQRTLDATRRSIAIPPLQTFVSEALDKLRSTVGQTPLTKAVLDLLVPLLVPFSGETKHPLMGVIEATRNQTEEAVGYVGGNATTLLLALNISALAGKDLYHSVINGANLTSAILQSTNFSGAFLRNLLIPQLFGAIFAIAYSPNGEFFATAGSTCDINLWRTRDNQPIITLQGHVDWVRSLAFVTDGTRLISAAFDDTIRIWDVKTGHCLCILNGHNSRVNAVAIAPDSNKVISASDDQTIKIWNSNTGECLKTLEGHTAEVEAVLVSPNANFIISGGSDYRIIIWNLQTGELLQSLEGHTDRIRSIALSPDGRTLVSGSRDQTIRLWNLQTNQCVRVLQSHTDGISSVTFNQDGMILASSCYDQTIKLWAVETGQCIKTLLGHTDWVRVTTFSPDGHTVMSGSDDQTIRKWDVETGEILEILQGYAGELRSIAISPVGQTLAIGNEDKYLRLWTNINWDWKPDDVEISSAQPSLVKLFRGHESRINSVKISPNGKLIATGSFDHCIKIWDAQTGTCLKTLKGHERCVNSVAFNPDGEMLASASADKTVRLWNIKTGDCLRVLEGPDNWLWTVTISPDNRWIAGGGDDRSIRVWDIQSGECVATLIGHSGGVNSIVFTPDCQTLISGSSDNTIRLWHVEDWKYQRSLQGHSNVVLCLDIVSHGNTLVSSSHDRSLKIWDIKTGECLKTFHGHTNGIRSVVFTPDGKKLISGSFDQTIKLWDIETGECLNTLGFVRPYDGMNITKAKGLTEVEKATLKALGAVEKE